MILQELILQNFGPYLGRQTLDLSPTDDGKTIILFGGMNGGGKTTLMDAIRLALYGQRALCSSRGNLSYSDFLSQCVNRQATEAATIELSFSLSTSGASEPTQFRICRTWSPQPKSGRDSLTIFQDGQQDPALTKGWDEHIEALLPLGISNLFLFDGEQVKELAEQEHPPAFVIGAMRSLLGLELPDRLSADLDILAKRKSKAIANDSARQDIETLETEIAQLEEDRLSRRKQLASLRQKLDTAEVKAEQAQERFLSEGGQIAAEQVKTQTQIEQLQAEIATHRQTLRNLAAELLPLGLIQPLLAQALPQAKKEQRQQQFSVAQELLQERNDQLLDHLEKIEVADATFKKIEDFLYQQEDALKANGGNSWLAADEDAVTQLSSILEHGLPAQQKQAKALVQQLSNCQAELDSLERYLTGAASPEAYDKLTEAVRTSQANLQDLQKAHSQTQAEHEQLKGIIAQTNQALIRYSETILERESDEHMLGAIDRVQEKLQLFQSRLKLQKLNQLETLVTECFLYLLHKSKLVHRIQIDTDSFGLQLFDYEGDPIPKNRLSAGEKQLLAISLLWGLARASGRQLPVAVDTPLGRLDSKHRKNLVERYFPEASHQVLILSTDTEIGEKEVKRLRKDGTVAREYLLNHDPKQQQTQITPGYFW